MKIHSYLNLRLVVLVTSGLELEVIRKACECDFLVQQQQTEFFCAHSASFVDCAAAAV